MLIAEANRMAYLWAWNIWNKHTGMKGQQSSIENNFTEPLKNTQPSSFSPTKFKFYE